jgi:hypothetical protein
LTINPFVGAFANTIIRAGHPVFVCRSEPQHVSVPGQRSGGDLAPFTVLSLAQLNMTLRDAYDEGMTALAEHERLTRGLPKAGFIDYLGRDEATWSELFLDNGTRIRNHKVFKHLYYLCKEGILRRWNYFGISILPSAADTQVHGEFAYLPLNVATKGVRKYVANLWGEKAGHGANLSFILKRRYDRMSGNWGAFAFCPYASNDPVVSLSARAYTGISGATEYGEVIPVGFVRASYKMTMAPDKLALVQGLSEDCTPSLEFVIGKEIPTLDIAIHNGLIPAINCLA